MFVFFVVLIARIRKQMWLFVDCGSARQDHNKSGMAGFCVKVYFCVFVGSDLLVSGGLIFLTHIVIKIDWRLRT